MSGRYKTRRRPRAHRAVGRGPPASRTGRRYVNSSSFRERADHTGRAPDRQSFGACRGRRKRPNRRAMKAKWGLQGRFDPIRWCSCSVWRRCRCWACCSFRRSRSRRIYHRFADQQTLLGIPNFWNVVSNLPFILVGAVGSAMLPPRSVGGHVLPRRVPDRLQLVLLPLESERRRAVLGPPADGGRVHGDPGQRHRGADRRQGRAGRCSGRWSRSAS